MKKPDGIERIPSGDIRLLYIKPAVIEPEVGRRSKLRPRTPREDAVEIAHVGTVLSCLSSRLDKIVRVQIPDVFCDQEVMLHEPLDAEKTLAVVVAQSARHLGLQIEGQTLLGFAGEKRR